MWKSTSPFGSAFLVVEAVRSRGVALTRIDRGWMPRPAQRFDRFDPITANFTYVRWLGDRKAIEKETKVWDRVIVDRHAEPAEWTELLAKIAKRGVLIYEFANNHCAGHASATVELFRELWSAQVRDAVISTAQSEGKTLLDYVANAMGTQSSTCALFQQVQNAAERRDCLSLKIA